MVRTTTTFQVALALSIGDDCLINVSLDLRHRLTMVMRDRLRS